MVNTKSRPSKVDDRQSLITEQSKLKRSEIKDSMEVDRRNEVVTNYKIYRHYANDGDVQKLLPSVETCQPEKLISSPDMVNSRDQSDRDHQVESTMNSCCRLVNQIQLNENQSDNHPQQSTSEQYTLASRSTMTSSDDVESCSSDDQKESSKLKSRTKKSKKNSRPSNTHRCRSYNSQGRRRSRVSSGDASDQEGQKGNQTVVKGRRRRSRKVCAKLFVKKAGKKLWKGLRVSCKFLWSGLVLYAKPFSAIDLNITRACEEKLANDRKRQYHIYEDLNRSQSALI